MTLPILWKNGSFQNKITGISEYLEPTEQAYKKKNMLYRAYVNQLIQHCIAVNTIKLCEVNTYTFS